MARIRHKLAVERDDPAAVAPLLWHAALRRYLAAIAVGNLAWEFLHIPLYTIGRIGTWWEITFAVLHCTGGDT